MLKAKEDHQEGAREDTRQLPHSRRALQHAASRVQALSQLPSDVRVPHTVPAVQSSQVTGCGTASAIAAGRSHSCAIQAGTDEVVCWGSDFSGEASPPASVDGTEGTASAISLKLSSSLAIAVPEPNAGFLALAAVVTLTALRRSRRRPRGTP